jgi:hypothetical protein
VRDGALNPAVIYEAHSWITNTIVSQGLPRSCPTCDIISMLRSTGIALLGITCYHVTILYHLTWICGALEASIQVYLHNAFHTLSQGNPPRPGNFNLHGADHVFLRCPRRGVLVSWKMFLSLPTTLLFPIRHFSWWLPPCPILASNSLYSDD